MEEIVMIKTVMILKQRLTQIECLIGKRENAIKSIISYPIIIHLRSTNL